MFSTGLQLTWSRKCSLFPLRWCCWILGNRAYGTAAAFQREWQEDGWCNPSTHLLVPSVIFPPALSNYDQASIQRVLEQSAAPASLFTRLIQLKGQLWRAQWARMRTELELWLWRRRWSEGCKQWCNMISSEWGVGGGPTVADGLQLILSPISQVEGVFIFYLWRGSEYILWSAHFSHRTPNF